MRCAKKIRAMRERTPIISCVQQSALHELTDAAMTVLFDFSYN